MSIQTIGTIINVLKWAYEHRQEEAQAAELGIHFLRRIEHSIVHHKTDLDTFLVEADKALVKYNEKQNKNLDSNTNRSSSSVD